MTYMRWILSLVLVGLAVAAPNSAARPTFTPVSGGSSTIDDTPAIESAIKANPTGTIVIPSGTTYNIGSQLQFTGCKGCTLQIDGTLLVTVNFPYWNDKGSIFLMKDITGATIKSSTGEGIIDGNGQASWDYIVSYTSYNRPFLFVVDGSTDIQMYDLTLRNSPSFHVVTGGNSKNVSYRNLTIYAVSNSANAAHNTDGFDIGPASHVTVENITVTNDDDCIALKPGASYVHATSVVCNGSHGLSVGSLGGSPGSDQSVTNCLIDGAVMKNSTKAAGLKLYPGGPSFGTSTVSNVTWRNIVSEGAQYAMQIQTCYGQTSSYCAEYPSTAKLTGVVFENFSGVTSGKAVANLNCPPSGSCGVVVEGMTVKGANRSSEVLCANTPTNLGATCAAEASG
jgi:galacturan 1,4-alpha-galacturonidase